MSFQIQLPLDIRCIIFGFYDDITANEFSAICCENDLASLLMLQKMRARILKNKPLLMSCFRIVCEYGHLQIAEWLTPFCPRSQIKDFCICGSDTKDFSTPPLNGLFGLQILPCGTFIDTLYVSVSSNASRLATIISRYRHQRAGLKASHCKS